MTVARRDGNDSPFGAWLRQQDALSSQHFVASDIDYAIHRYRPEVDRVGTREINYMMFVETKSHGASLSQSQHETLWFQHQFFQKNSGKRTLHLVGGKAKRAVWHFGCSVVSMEYERPGDGWILWGRFDFAGEVKWREITEQQLVSLFRFDLNPNSLERMSARRHHKTSEIHVSERTPLGFDCVKTIVKRS